MTWQTPEFHGMRVVESRLIDLGSETDKSAQYHTVLRLLRPRLGPDGWGTAWLESDDPDGPWYQRLSMEGPDLDGDKAVTDYRELLDGIEKLRGR